MSFSGGVYTLPGPALQPGDTVSSTENNQFRNDVATAFNLTFLRNGTSTATANLPMGGYKLTGLGVATTSGDALSYGQAATVSDLTTSGTVTISSGTANGVAYLNGSKVLTTGSALTFDGTNLGVNSPILAARTLSVKGRAAFTATANDSQLAIYSDGVTNGLYSTYNSTGSYLPMTFYTSDLERMRIDSSGNLLVGTTSTSGGAKVRFVASGDFRTLSVEGNSSGGSLLANFQTGQASATMLYFQTSGGVAGSIVSTNTSTAYNTSSDYRLKENVQPMQNALGVVAQLNPVTYNWKADGSDGQGFIAHELQEVVPDCVTGEKDAVDAEGNPVYQGIDTSFLVATLTKAIQEQQEQINQLKAEVAALKGV